MSCSLPDMSKHNEVGTNLDVNASHAFAADATDMVDVEEINRDGAVAFPPAAMTRSDADANEGRGEEKEEAPDSLWCSPLPSDGTSNVRIYRKRLTLSGDLAEFETSSVSSKRVAELNSTPSSPVGAARDAINEWSLERSSVGEREVLCDMILYGPRLHPALTVLSKDQVCRIKELLLCKIDRFVVQAEKELTAKAALLKAKSDVEAIRGAGDWPSDRALLDRHLQLFDPKVRAVLDEEFLAPLRGAAKYLSPEKKKSTKTFISILLMSGAAGVGKTVGINRLAAIANRETLGVTLDSDVEDECRFVLFFEANCHARNPGRRLILQVARFYHKHDSGVLFIAIDEAQARGLAFFNPLKSFFDDGSLDLSSLSLKETENTLPRPRPGCQVAILILSNSYEHELTVERRNEYLQMNPTEALALRNKVLQQVVSDSFNNDSWYSRLSKAVVLPMFQVDEETMEQLCPFILAKTSSDVLGKCVCFDHETMVPWMVAQFKLDPKAGIRGVNGALQKRSASCASKFRARHLAIYAEKDDHGAWKAELKGTAMHPPGDTKSNGDSVDIMDVDERKDGDEEVQSENDPSERQSDTELGVDDSESDSMSEANNKKSRKTKKTKNKKQDESKDLSDSDSSSSSESESEMEDKVRSKKKKKQKKASAKRKSDQSPSDLPKKLDEQQAREYLQLAAHTMREHGEAAEIVPERALQTEGVDGAALLNEYRAHVAHYSEKLKNENMAYVRILVELGRVATAYETHLWPQEKSKLLAARQAQGDAGKAKIDVNSHLAKELGFTELLNIKGSNNYVTRCKQLYQIVVTFGQPALPYLFKALPSLGRQRFFGWLVPLRLAAKESHKAIEAGQ